MHYDYPLVGETIEAKKEIWSKYQFQIIEDNNFSLGKNMKRICNLSNKKIETPLLKCKTLFKCRVEIHKNS